MSIILDGVQAVRTTKTYVVNIAATSTFATQTTTAQLVRLSPIISCFYRIGTTTESAATSGLAGNLLMTGVVEYVRCNIGQTIHAITATAGLAAAGLSVAEVTE